MLSRLNLLLVAGVVVLAPVLADGARPFRVGPDKKLIEWGWDEPNTAFMRENAERMDRVGFDGVIFHAEPVVDGQPVNFAWSCWSSRRFEYEQFAQVVADLQACRFQRMTDNFLRFNVCPGDVDWFDDEAFAVVAHNAAVGARVAREGGCKGFMFDIEMYGEPLWTYEKLKHRETKSFAEYEAIVTQRGREFMRAVNAEYPDITMMMTFGYGISGVGTDRSKVGYGLLKNFLDGMYEVAAPRTTIVDGYEGAYSFRRHQQFREAYKTTREKMASFCSVPDRYRKHLRVGFGIWMDMDFRRYGWDLRDFERNYFTPDEFAYSVFCGLSVCDRYVWVYTEKPLWWTHTRVPTAYRLALRRARGPMAIEDERYGRRNIKGMPPEAAPRAAAQPGYSDEDTFGDVAGKWDFVADLPRVWKFRTDPRGEGMAAKWYAPDADTSEWCDLEIAKFWDEQGVQHIGQAWYRITWETPQFAVPPGGRAVLWFGAVDETAKVWVNGKLAGGHDEGADFGWDKRFAVDVTGKLLPGQTNVVAVQVGNAGLAGGIWKNVKLAVSKP